MTFDEYWGTKGVKIMEGEIRKERKKLRRMGCGEWYIETYISAYATGFKKGFEKGFKKSMNQEKTDCALGMLREGTDDPFILKVTGVTPEVLSLLKKIVAKEGE